jgi:hypothetical protein
MILLAFALSALNLWIGTPLNLWASGFAAGWCFSLIVAAGVRRIEQDGAA